MHARDLYNVWESNTFFKLQRNLLPTSFLHSISRRKKGFNRNNSTKQKKNESEREREEKKGEKKRAL